MIRKSSLSRLIVLLSVPFIVASCGKKSTPTGPSAEPTLESVTIVGKDTFTVGEVYQLKAIAKYSDGTETDVTNKSAWVTFNSGAISVNATTGLLTALAVGKCGVIATFEGKTGTLRVEVFPAPPGGPNGPNGPNESQRPQRSQ